MLVHLCMRPTGRAGATAEGEESSDRGREREGRTDEEITAIRGGSKGSQPSIGEPVMLNLTHSLSSLESLSLPLFTCIV